MTGFGSKRAWSLKPPPGSRVAASHPLAASLRAAWLLHEGGQRAFDLAERRDFHGTLAANAGWKPGLDGGLVLTCSGVQPGGVVLPALGLGGAPPMSFAARWFITSGIGPVVGWGGAVDNTASYVYAPADGNVTWGMWGDPANLAVTGLDAFVGVRRITFLGTWDGTTRRLYVDGRVATSTQAFNWSDTNYAIGDIVFSAGAVLNGWVDYFYVWDRPLTPDEVEWVRREPFAFFHRPLAVRFTVSIEFTGSFGDAQRDFGAPSQDVTVTFSAAAQDAALIVGQAATGWTLRKNGVAQTTLYQGGSGTATWTLRAPVLVTAADALTLQYDPAAGNTTFVSGGAELQADTQALSNLLTKRVRFVVRNAAGQLIASTTVKFSVHTYAGGAPANAAWMTREQKATPTTDGQGVLDAEYTGLGSVGDAVYVALIEPDAVPAESFVWPVAIT